MTRAAIVLAPTGAKITGPGWAGRREWSLLALHSELARQSSWRGAPAPAGPQRHWAHQLRLIGCEPDAVGRHTYTLVVQPETVRVKSTAGYDRSFSTDSLQRRAQLALYLRKQQPESTQRAETSPATIA
jgi:hypothetical protein